MRVLVAVAHPDDELLGVGGTILRHKAAGDEVWVHIECTKGLRDRDARLKTASEIAAEVGYTLTAGHSPQLGYKVPSITVDADIVYTHHPGDLNRDHRLVSEGVQVACRPYTADVRSLRYFETPSSTEWGEPFVPNLFAGIDPIAKQRLVERYDSELRDFPHPRSLRALHERASYWGSVSGLAFAEAFTVARETW